MIHFSLVMCRVEIVEIGRSVAGGQSSKASTLGRLVTHTAVRQWLPLRVSSSSTFHHYSATPQYLLHRPFPLKFQGPTVYSDIVSSLNDCGRSTLVI